MTRAQKQEHRIRTERWLDRSQWKNKKFDQSIRSAHAAKKKRRKITEASRRLNRHK